MISVDIEMNDVTHVDKVACVISAGSDDDAVVVRAGQVYCAHQYIDPWCGNTHRVWANVTNWTLDQLEDWLNGGCSS